MHPRSALLVTVLSTATAAFGQKQFTPLRHTAVPISIQALGIAAGDVDGDGDRDLVVANDYAPTQLLLNDGRGAFVDGTSGRLVTPTPSATWGVELADVDGDGDLDLLEVNDRSLLNRLYVNDGAGVFRDVTMVAVPPHRYRSGGQLVRDFDNDGDLDWLVLERYPTAPHLYLNDGNGRFTDASIGIPAGAGGGDFGVAAVIDLEEDGDLDVLIELVFAPYLQVLLNQGNAVFQLAAPGILPVTGSGPIWITDVDRDGHVDVIHGYRRLFRNLGGGRFVDVSATAFPGFMRPGCVPADADMDGDVDFVATGMLWLNDGHGAFVADNSRGPQVSAGLGPPFAPLACDIDGDGDHDYVGTQIAVNLCRQVSAPDTPRTGQRYEVEVAVRPGFATSVAFALPYLGFRDALIPLPHLGTLRLDPALAVALPSLVLTPPVGIGRILYSVPPVASLAGVELHHQALISEVAVPAALSNALADVIAQ